MFYDAREVALLAFESNQSSRFLIKPRGIPYARFSIMRTHEILPFSALLRSPSPFF